MAANAAAKKGKGKKALDSSEASKLVAARISQLEVDTAAEKEQEAEIGRFTAPLDIPLGIPLDMMMEPPTMAHNLVHELLLLLWTLYDVLLPLISR